MGWENLATKPGMQIVGTLERPENVDDGDGKIIKTWEVANEHRER